MRRNHTLLVVEIIVLVVLIILTAATITRQYKGQAAEYPNLFEYAVDLKNEEYAYAPAQVTYGMSLEELFQAQNLNGKEMVADDSGEIIYATETLRNVSENIGEVDFAQKFTVMEDYGLVGASYRLVVDKDDFEEVCSILYEQAVAYMPENVVFGSVERIKKGQHVGWFQDERVSGSAYVGKCGVSVDFHSPYGYEDSKMMIELSVNIQDAYLKYLSEKERG